MQKLKKWTTKIKLQSLLRNKGELTSEEKEIAQWFLNERNRFQTAMQSKREKLSFYLVTLKRSYKDQIKFEHSNYVCGLQNKLKFLSNLCNEIDVQQETLSKLISD